MSSTTTSYGTYVITRHTKHGNTNGSCMGNDGHWFIEHMPQCSLLIIAPASLHRLRRQRVHWHDRASGPHQILKCRAIVELSVLSPRKHEKEIAKPKSFSFMIFWKSLERTHLSDHCEYLGPHCQPASHLRCEVQMGKYCDGCCGDNGSVDGEDCEECLRL